MDNDRLISAREAAALLGYKTRTGVMRFVAEGKLRGFRPGGRRGWWRFRESDVRGVLTPAKTADGLDDFVNKHSVAVGGETPAAAAGTGPRAWSPEDDVAVCLTCPRVFWPPRAACPDAPGHDVVRLSVLHTACDSYAPIRDLRAHLENRRLHPRIDKADAAA